MEELKGLPPEMQERITSYVRHNKELGVSSKLLKVVSYKFLSEVFFFENGLLCRFLQYSGDSSVSFDCFSLDNLRDMVALLDGELLQCD